MRILYFKIYGIILAVISAFLLIYRESYLFLRLTGAAYLIIFVIFLIYSTITILLRKPVSIRLKNTSDAGTVLDSDQKLILNRLPYIMPGFCLRLHGTLFYSSGSEYMFREELFPCGGNEISFHGNFTTSGRCELRDIKIEVYDFAGLFSIMLPTPERITFNITPAMQELNLNDAVFSDGGENNIVSPVSKDSTDFFESRKYYPGDDIRRLNWKLFAHSGDLYLRETEKIPPDTGRIRVIFAPASDIIDETNTAVSLFRSFALDMINSHLELEVESSGRQYILNSTMHYSDVIDEIINSKPHSPADSDTTGTIIFTTFYESAKLIPLTTERGNSTIIAAYKTGEYSLKRMLKRIFIPQKSDLLPLEITDMMRESEFYRKREEILDNLTAAAASKKIRLHIAEI